MIILDSFVHFSELNLLIVLSLVRSDYTRSKENVKCVYFKCS